MVTVLCMVQKFISSIITTMTLHFESDLRLLVSIGGVPACKFCEVVKVFPEIGKLQHQMWTGMSQSTKRTEETARYLMCVSE